MTTRQRWLALVAFFALGLLLVWRDSDGVDEVAGIWMSVSALGLVVPFTATFGGLPENRQRLVGTLLIVLWALWSLGCTIWAVRQ